MTAPTVSVLVTYFNEGSLLTDCLNSLIGQQPRPAKIILYDDASTTPPEPFLPRDLPVRIIRGKVNRGPAHGRNQLLRAAQSEYVHFHDADDWFHPDWCRRVVGAIQDSKADAVFTEVASTRDSKPSFDGRVLGLARLNEDPDLIRFCIQGAMLVPAATFRRDKALAVGGYREEIWQSEDYDFYIRLAAAGLSYTAIDEPLVAIRLRPDSRSQQRVEVWRSALQAMESLRELLPEKYRTDLADRAVRIGATLYNLAHRQEARRAFEWAKRTGPPTFQGMPSSYRWIASWLGPEWAERIGRFYRRSLPAGWRETLRSK